MKKIIVAFALALSVLSIQSCDRAQANVQTLISNDCGVSWELIQPGQTIPKQFGTCGLKTTIPGSPMTGESHFKSTFANKVQAQIDLDYEYVINDPVKFITEAKYLAKTNADGDDVSSGSSRFESAENSIIDKRIKDVARDLLGDIDLVDFDQSDFEDALLLAVNKKLIDRGVVINYLSFVPEPSRQAAEAIDVATAMRIYESKGLSDVGKQVIANKAGANNITINGNSVETNTGNNK